MRLIDADELVKNLEEALKINPPKDRQKFLFQVGAVKILEGIINEAEERFTDAVEVVRCKECIYYKEKGYDSHPYCYYFDEPWSPSRGISREPNDFCSKGERKTK